MWLMLLWDHFESLSNGSIHYFMLAQSQKYCSMGLYPGYVSCIQRGRVVTQRSIWGRGVDICWYSMIHCIVIMNMHNFDIMRTSTYVWIFVVFNLNFKVLFKNIFKWSISGCSSQCQMLEDLLGDLFLNILLWCLRVHGSIPDQLKCFEDMEKAFDRAFWHFVGGALEVWGLRCCFKGFCLCMPEQNFALQAKSHTYSQCMLDSNRVALCHQIWSLFLWTEYLGVA